MAYFPTSRLLAGAWLLSIGAGCARRPVAANSSPAYELVRFRRYDPAGAPLITGTIDQRQADGTRYPLAVARRLQNFAVLAVDGVQFNSQPNGRYVQKLTAGHHQLKVGLPGLVRVDLPLRIRQGDSIRLDFHLRADIIRLNGRN